MPPTATLPVPPDPPVALERPRLRGWLHAAAVPSVIVAGAILVARAPNAGSTAALVVYWVAMTALFGVSAAFHRVRWQPAARRRMRRADHATIFVGIAGTYTAVAALALSGWARLVVLLLVWVGGGAGVALRQLWLDAPKWAVSLPYIVVGWCALAVIPQLMRGMGTGGFTLLVLGGAAYTAGAVVYARKRPDPVPRVFGYHEVFHACTLIGASLHYAAVFAYALPAAAH
ncbi:MAG TPA: hemolysin III family protein [Acidimicrobiales bacterium]|nr:hemolysin III family protein [Acidimicrobiales bacterium]